LVEPTADGLAFADRPGLANKREERCLKGIFSVLSVAENTLTGAQDHSPVPPDEQLEGGFVTLADKPFQERRIGQGVPLLSSYDSAQITHDTVNLSAGHGPSLWA
jgi:hypothetical protein